jgi:hypothetical protein
MVAQLFQRVSFALHRVVGACIVARSDLFAQFVKLLYFAVISFCILWTLELSIFYKHSDAGGLRLLLSLS